MLDKINWQSLALAAAGLVYAYSQLNARVDNNTRATETILNQLEQIETSIQSYVEIQRAVDKNTQNIERISEDLEKYSESVEENVSNLQVVISDQNDRFDIYLDTLRTHRDDFERGDSELDKRISILEQSR